MGSEQAQGLTLTLTLTLTVTLILTRRELRAMAEEQQRAEVC